ncbi:MAG TPA: hypothetical protein G4O01_04085 [Dehalococcoidia bacterium]|nr:hypothetical protein [Dehalococcoidia bacterium]
MMWLRRAIILPLALLFIILSILLLVVFRVNATVGNPDFYNEQLRQADIYNFIYTEVLPAALEETELGDADIGLDISQLKPHIMGIAEQTLPPEWLEAQVEQTIEQVVPYLWGDTEGFQVNITLKDRVEAGAQALKDTLHKEEIFSELYDGIIGLIIAKLEADAELPPFFAFSVEEMERVLRTVLPEAWVLRQVDAAIDEVVPYFTGDTERFTVRIEIIDRLDALEEVLADMLGRAESYERLFEVALAPVIEQSTGEMAQLPIGLSLTSEEVLAAVRETMPLEWYQARVSDILAQLFSYLKGESETLEVTIPLGERKPAIARALGELADQKLESIFDSLPECTSGHLWELLAKAPLETIPECKPPGMSYQEFKELVGIDFELMLIPLVDMWVPDQWTLSEAELRQMFGGEGEEDFLEKAREWVQTGLVFTSEDLRENLGPDYETVEKVRRWIATGLIFTDQDLRQGIGSEQLGTLEQARSTLGMVRRWLMAAWVIPALLLLAIGVLGSRRWSARLLWAAVVLAAMAVLAYLAFGPLFSAMAQPRIDEALMSAVGQVSGFQALAAEKGVSLAQNAIDSFIGGLRGQALGLLIVSGVLIGVGVVWHFWGRIRQT